MAQEFSQQAAVAQTPSQEVEAMPLYAKPNKLLGTGSGYEGVDAMSDDSGIDGEFRDDDFDDYAEVSLPSRTGAFYENVGSLNLMIPA